MRPIAALCIILFGWSLSTAHAQHKVGDSGELSGLVFGDFYWIPFNHNEDLEGNTGFWFRRIYLTYDYEMSDSFSGRFRLEANSEGDFTSSSSMVPDVKDAYLRWRSNEEDHSIYAGISSTPTFNLTEDVWGYRPVEKSPLDLHGFGSSRDFGIKAMGQLGEDRKLGYNFMFGNGNSNRNEINKGKKVMLALNYQLTEHWVIEGYGDYNGLPQDRNIYTGQVFLGYQSDNLNAGALYAYQFRNNTVNNGDLNQNLASVFANATISDELSALLRLDHMFDPNPNGEGIDYLPFSNGAPSTLVIAGLDLLVGPDIHLIPNFEAIIYGENDLGQTPGADLQPRLTIYYNF